MDYNRKPKIGSPEAVPHEREQMKAHMVDVINEHVESDYGLVVIPLGEEGGVLNVVAWNAPSSYPDHLRLLAVELIKLAAIVQQDLETAALRELLGFPDVEDE